MLGAGTGGIEAEASESVEAGRTEGESGTGLCMAEGAEEEDSARCGDLGRGEADGDDMGVCPGVDCKDKKITQYIYQNIIWSNIEVGCNCKSGRYKIVVMQ